MVETTKRMHWRRLVRMPRDRNSLVLCPLHIVLLLRLLLLLFFLLHLLLLSQARRMLEVAWI
jgi:hypothetical protein